MNIFLDKLVPLVGEPDLNDSVDRLVKAAQLYRDGSVKRILVTGGA